MSCDCNTLVVGEAGPQGPQGLAGINGTNGTNGINAFTTVAEEFTQPALNDSVTFTVVENSWIGVGQTIYISQAGFYTVTSLGGTNEVNATLVRIDGIGDGDPVPAGIKVSPSASATYSDPLNELNVNGNSSLDGQVIVNDSNANLNFTARGTTADFLLTTKASTNQVGINTQNPAATLDVTGTLKISDSVDFVKDVIVNSSNGSNNFTVKTAGPNTTLFVKGSSSQVGIGTNSPELGKILDVNGDAQIATLLVNPTGVGGTEVFKVKGASSAVPFIVNATTNRVGIKTASPTVELDVTGETKISGNVTVGSNVLKVNSTGTFVGINKATPTVALDVVGAASISGALSVGGASNLDSITVTNGVTVGTTLGVTGGSNLASLDVTGATNIGGNFAVATSTLKVNTATNKVGVNTSSPTVDLDVFGSVKASDYRIITGSGGAKLTGFYFATGNSHNLSSLTANASNTFTDTVTGCVIGDFVLASYSSVPATTDFKTDVVFSCKVTGIDTVTITFTNTDASGNGNSFSDSVIVNYLVIRASAS